MLIAFLVLLAIVVGIVFFSGWHEGKECHKIDCTSRTAILSAFGPELDLLVETTTVSKVVTINGRTFTLGVLEGKNVVLTKTGISMVNAAMSTMAAISNFEINAILVSGIAGGINNTLHIGDVTVAERWASYHEAYYAREINSTFPQPFPIPGVYDPAPDIDATQNFGMFYPQGTYLSDSQGTADAETLTTWMYCDPALLAVAQSIVGLVPLEQSGINIFTNLTANLTYPPRLVVGGNGVAGTVFVDNAAFRNYTGLVWNPNALDMESSAVAHVATVNHIPFLVFRSLSDLAGGGPGENEIGIFLGIAAHNAAEALLTFLQAWN